MQTDRHKARGQSDRQTGRPTVTQAQGTRTDRQTDRQTGTRHVDRDRQTGTRHADRHRQTDRHTGKGTRTDGQTDRQTDIVRRTYYTD